MIKICIECKIEKSIIEFDKGPKYEDKTYYNGKCKECRRIYMRSDKAKEAQIKYRNTEQGKINKHRHKKTIQYKANQKEYEKKKLRNNDLFRLRKLVRDRVRKALKSKKWIRNTLLSNYLGCELSYLKAYLESKFQSGMSWENRGKWHIDHIIPLSLAITPEELYKLCHYTNLQPLWAKDNQLKSNKII